MSGDPRRPLWLLDVDGVLNAVQVPPEPGFVRADVGGSVVYRPAVTARIRALHDAGLVDIRWLTTWSPERVRSLAEVTGMPTGRPAAGGQWWQAAPSRAWWKALTAREVAEANPGRLIIWTDDDLDGAYGSPEMDWVISRPMLRICPDWRYGLTDEHLAAITAAVRLVQVDEGDRPGGGGVVDGVDVGRPVALDQPEPEPPEQGADRVGE